MPITVPKVFPLGDQSTHRFDDEFTGLVPQELELAGGLYRAVHRKHLQTFSGNHYVFYPVSPLDSMEGGAQTNRIMLRTKVTSFFEGEIPVKLQNYPRQHHGFEYTIYWWLGEIAMSGPGYNLKILHDLNPELGWQEAFVRLAQWYNETLHGLKRLQHIGSISSLDSP